MCRPVLLFRMRLCLCLPSSVRLHAHISARLPVAIPHSCTRRSIPLALSYASICPGPLLAMPPESTPACDLPTPTPTRVNPQRFELAFNIIFLLELLINMYSLGGPFKPFWSSGWNVFDTIIVTVGVVLMTGAPYSLLAAPGPASHMADDTWHLADGSDHHVTTMHSTSEERLSSRCISRVGAVHLGADHV